MATQTLHKRKTIVAVALAIGAVPLGLSSSAFAEPPASSAIARAPSPATAGRAMRSPGGHHEIVLKQGDDHGARSPAFSTAAAVLARNTVWSRASSASSAPATLSLRIHHAPSERYYGRTFQGAPLSAKAVFHAPGSQTTEHGTTKIEEIVGGKVTSSILVEDRRPAAGTGPVGSAVTRLFEGGRATISTKDASALARLNGDDTAQPHAVPDTIRITHPDGRVEEIAGKDAAVFKQRLTPMIAGQKDTFMQGYADATAAPSSPEAKKLAFAHGYYERTGHVLRSSVTPR